MTQVRRPDLTPLQRGYGLLLFAYPKAHRDAYGFWMRQAFSDLSAEVQMRSGWVGLAALLAQVLVDTLVSAARERHAAGHLKLLFVLQARYRLLMMLGAAQIALAGLAYAQPGIQYIYVGVYSLLQVLFIPGTLLAGLGLIGAAMDQRGGIRWALGTAGSGAVVFAAIYAAQEWISLEIWDDVWWFVFISPAVVYILALVLAGVMLLRQRRLWGLLCACLGAGQWAYWSTLNARGILIGASWPDVAMFFVFGMGFFVLSLLLYRSRHQTEQSVDRFEMM